MSEKTIAAVATPLGEASIGVIRISGSDAIKTAERCFTAFSGERLGALDGYRAAYGNITEENGAVIDDAVALVFRAPKSYTGEDVVEISVHGGRQVLRRALRRVLECGAQMAAAGEFTKRAFLNGKLDLAKAESVMELISAKNQTALKISRDARDGVLSRAIEEICDRLLETAASLAVYADYPDEELEGLSPERFSALLEECYQKTERLLLSYDAGRIVREGIDCAIVGKPNVGKSSLMNMLCGSERSIVTDIAGTTRDIIENTVNIGDVTLNLADTAGIHETADTVERVGVDRANKRIENAGLVLAVFDASSPLDSDDKNLLAQLKDKRAIAVLNKTDMPQRVSAHELSPLTAVEISALNNTGYDELSREISRACDLGLLDSSDAVLISERQYDCARRALEALSGAREAILSGITLDAVSVCIDDAIAAFLELTGKRVTNEVADEVFKRFCVGK